MSKLSIFANKENREYFGADDTITLTREQLLETVVEHSQKIDNRSTSMLICMHLTSFCETLFEKYSKDIKTKRNKE